MIDPTTLAAGAALAGAGALALVKRHHKPQRAGETTHGSAGWADEKEMKSLLVPIEARPAPGALVLAPSPWSKNHRLDIDRELASRHVLIVGKPGSGKSRGFFLWNCAHYQGSFITSDPKSESWIYTSGYRARPVRYAPRDPDNSASFNWIPRCRDDAHLTLLLARAVITNDDGDGGGHPFFTRADTAFLAALFAHAATFSTPTPAAMYDFLTSHSGDALTEILLKSKSKVAQQFATIFSQAKAELRGSIMIGCATTLVWLADERVRRFTSSTFELPSFAELRTKPTSIYWCLAENDVAVLKPLSTLFFTLALYDLKQASGDVPINLLLDEVANIGRIPNFETEIAVLRGRGVGVTAGLQSVSQWDAVYGAAKAQVMVDNFNTTIVLAGLDYSSANYVSQALGEQTICEERESQTARGGFFSRDHSTTKSVMKFARALLTPDELRRIGEREQIIITTNKRPLKTKRFWYEHPVRTAKVSGLGETKNTFGSKNDGSNDETSQPNLKANADSPDVPFLPAELLIVPSAETPAG